MNEESTFDTTPQKHTVLDALALMDAVDVPSFVVLERSDSCLYEEPVTSGMGVVMVLTMISENPPWHYWLRSGARGYSDWGLSGRRVA